jgi:hypothetical protein
MLKYLTSVAAVGLAACQSGSAKDCNIPKEEGLRCLERYRCRSDRELLLGCFPFSQPERISGAWVSGFETNEFYEGEKASPSLVNKRIGDTELELGDDGPAGPYPIVSDMVFLGRRSQCEMAPSRHIIIVDQIISPR